MNEYSFIRYLTSKKSVDDRSLNAGVWQALAAALPPSSEENPLRVLETGAGIGAMLQRALERELFTYVQYTLVDADPSLIAYGLDSLPGWASAQGFQAIRQGGSVRLLKPGREIQAIFHPAEALSFVQQARQAWDLIIAHAFLDLLNLEKAVPVLLSALNQRGLLYATINFDGLTILEPAIDPEFDELIQAMYHQTMDERLVDGQPSGDSRTGRRLFSMLRRQGAQILAAGASDWVVFSGPQGYACDEAYFLHFIIHTIEGALGNHPAIDPARFQEWVKARRAQIERGELVYIAHQIDVLAKR